MVFGGLFNQFLTFSFAVLIGTSAQETSITYSPSYASSYIMSNSESSRVFSSYFDSSAHIASFNDLQKCKNVCSETPSCLGIVERGISQPECVLLDSLGVPVKTNITSVSFTKTTFFDERDRHTIYGHFYPKPESNIFSKHTVYLDINHNGMFDSDEPYNTTVNNSFEFSNMTSGNYLVREIQDDQCIQVWPGVWGSSRISGYTADTYVDSVVYYYKNGHSDRVVFDGGYTSKNKNIKDAPMSFVLGNSKNTFLSFRPSYGIVFAFLNEVIVGGNGSDIVIKTFGNSSTKAHVSVSYNNIDYTPIGVLNNTNKQFDLGAVNYTRHVAYVKLHFFNENPLSKETINIVSVKGVSYNSYYSPPYAVYATVPQNDEIVFIKDCHYYYSCVFYCIFSRVSSDSIHSCITGCQMWESTGTCGCENYNSSNVTFYGKTYRSNDCYDGCAYNIKRDVYPDYDVKLNATGVDYYIDSEVTCSKEKSSSSLSKKECVLGAVDACSNQSSCESVSFGNDNNGFLYNDHRYVEKENSYFIVKKSSRGNKTLVRYMTTTPTTTATDTPTTTATDTATTTPTVTATTNLDIQPELYPKYENYKLVFVGQQICRGKRMCNKGRRFSTAKVDNHTVHFITNTDSVIEKCLEHCNENIFCRGIYIFTSIKNDTRCRGLSNLGTEEGKITYQEGYSYMFTGNKTIQTTPTTTQTITVTVTSSLSETSAIPEPLSVSETISVSEIKTKENLLSTVNVVSAKPKNITVAPAPASTVSTGLETPVVSAVKTTSHYHKKSRDVSSSWNSSAFVISLVAIILVVGFIMSVCFYRQKRKRMIRKNALSKKDHIGFSNPVYEGKDIQVTSSSSSIGSPHYLDVCPEFSESNKSPSPTTLSKQTEV